jgi:branched-chain amino acid transport system substrate-binding protein
MKSFARRNLLAGSAAAGLSAALAGTARAQTRELVLGIVNPLTGPGADLGISAQQAIDPAIDAINKAGGVNGMKVRAVYRDDQSNPRTGVQVVTELLQRERVAMVMGANLTHVAFALAPVVNQAKVPFFTMATGDTIVDVEKFPYTFRINTANSVEAEKLVDHAMKAHGMKSPAFLVDNTAYGQSGDRALRAALARRNLQPVAVESFGLSDTDTSGQFSNLRKANPDVLFVWGLGGPLALASRSAERAGFTAPVYGGFGMHQEGFIKLGSPSGDKWAATIWRAFTQGATPAPEPVRAYVARQVKLYGDKLSGSVNISALWDDAMRMTFDAVKRAGSTDGDAIRSALQATTNFKGLISTFSFAKNKHDGFDPKDITIAFATKVDNHIRRRIPSEG